MQEELSFIESVWKAGWNCKLHSVWRWLWLDSKCDLFFNFYEISRQISLLLLVLSTKWIFFFSYQLWTKSMHTIICECYLHSYHEDGYNITSFMFKSLLFIVEQFYLFCLLVLFWVCFVVVGFFLGGWWWKKQQSIFSLKIFKNIQDMKDFRPRTEF